MTLPASGQISLNDVNVELGNSGTAQIGLGDSAVRDLFDISSGEIEMADGYGKSSFTPWTGASGQPTYQNFVGSDTGSTTTATYTPSSGVTSFMVMMWGSTGHGGNTINFSNLPPIGASSAGGVSYSEKVFSHSGSTTYSIALGNRAAYYATGGGYTPPFRGYASDTTFTYGGSVAMRCTGTGNPSSAGGVATGGTFNANGGSASSNNSGGGSGSRKGAGQGNGQLASGSGESSSAVTIDFMGWRGFDWSSDWGRTTGTVPTNPNGSNTIGLGANGRGYYHARSGDVAGGAALTAHEAAFSALIYPTTSQERNVTFTHGNYHNTIGGAVPYNQRNFSGSMMSQVLILEFYD